MNKFLVMLEVKEGQVQEILDRLTAAQDEIRDCYYELEKIGVLTIAKADSVEG